MHLHPYAYSYIFTCPITLSHKDTRTLTHIIIFKYVQQGREELLVSHTYLLYYKVGELIEGDQKAPFSIATTPKCRGGRYSIPWIAPLYP